MKPGQIQWSKPTGTTQTRSVQPGSISWSQPQTKEEQKKNNPGYVSRFLSGFKTGFTEEVKSAGKAQTSGGRGIYALRDASTLAWQTFFDTMEEAQNKFNQGIQRPRKADTWSDVVVAPAEMGLALINTALAAPMALFKGAEELPGIGWAAGTFNGLFAGMGNGSSEVALKGLYDSPLSQKSKDNLAPVVAETASLIGMVLGAKVGSKAFTGIEAKVEANINKIFTETKTEAARQLAVKSEFPQPTKVNIEKFYDERNMPVIDFGKPAKSNLPSIQLGVEPAPKPGMTGARYVWSEPKSDMFSGVERTAKTAETRTQSTGTEFQSRTGVRTAEESGLGRDVVPFQDRRNMQEAYKTADEYVLADPVKAERALADPTTTPKDLYVGDIYKALEAKANKEGDVALSLRLSQTTVGTEAARGLKAFDRPTDGTVNLVQELRDVRAARQAWQESTNKGLVVEKEAAKLVEKAELIRSPKIKDWQEFIKSLEC